MDAKRMSELSKRRVKIYEDIYEKLELVEQGKLDISNADLETLNKLIDELDEEYEKESKK